MKRFIKTQYFNFYCFWKTFTGCQHSWILYEWSGPGYCKDNYKTEKIKCTKCEAVRHI